MIEPGNPRGCASVDHSRNCGLRTRRRILAFALYSAIRYGPVAGTGRGTDFAGRGRHGDCVRKRKRELARKSPSGAVSSKTTVRAFRSVTMPRERSHALSFLHRSAPTIPA